MKHILKFTFLFFLIINNLFINAQKDKNTPLNADYILKSENPKFQISFPGTYKIEDSKTENGLKTMFYRSVKNNDIYMFKYTEHKNPAVSSDNKMYMEASLESFINGIRADLIKKYEFKNKKQKGLEAFLKIPDKNLHVFYRVIIHKHIQFQLIVITKSEIKTPEINRFFTSFSI